MSNQYEERDAMELDRVGNFYTCHVVAMTKEGLQSKADIAAELGYRDMVIDQQQAEINALKAHVERLRVYMESLVEESTGVAGWHKNGDIATWDELDIASVFDDTPQQNLAEHDAEVARRAFHEVGYIVANQYDGTDTSNLWNVGANDIFRRFMVEGQKYANKIKEGGL